MTNEDLILHITALQVCERKEIDRIRRQSRIDQQKLLDEWAIEHTRFHVGDIIESHSVILRVAKIIGQMGLGNTPFVEYRGRALTKRLKNRADGLVTSIYDDNPNRNIMKIK